MVRTFTTDERAKKIWAAKPETGKKRKFRQTWDNVLDKLLKEQSGRKQRSCH